MSRALTLGLLSLVGVACAPAKVEKKSPLAATDSATGTDTSTSTATDTDDGSTETTTETNTNTSTDEIGGTVASTLYWRQVAKTGQPEARSFSAIQWTGSEVVIWGGVANATSTKLDTGMRYDPATDSWTAMASGGAPSARNSPFSAVSNTELLIWGGEGLTSTVGGRYDLAEDKWKPMSSVDAPTARHSGGAVWTGDRFVVWGGYDGTFANTGAQYDPGGDSWVPTSTAGAPIGRSNHSTIWSGRVMVVWGGQTELSGENATDTGGVYDPSLNSWTPTSPVNAPSPRTEHLAVWTGAKMFVWGGYNRSAGAGTTTLPDGAMYDPESDKWSQVDKEGAPERCTKKAAAGLVDDYLIIWGCGPDQNQGAIYKLSKNNWLPFAAEGEQPGPNISNSRMTVSTGSALMVWTGAVIAGQVTGGKLLGFGVN